MTSKKVNQVSKTVAKKISVALKQARHIGLIGHVSGDLDSFGACHALKLFLRSQRKNAEVISQTGVKDQWKEALGKGFSVRADLPKNLDLIIALDCADASRLDADISTSTAKIINIDHHLSNSMFGNINLVVNTTSTCELLYDLLCLLDATSSWEKICARPLALGIIFDTANFSINGVSSRVFEIVTRLSRWVDIPTLVQILNSVSERSVLTFCKSFLKRKVLSRGRCLVVVLDADDEAEWHVGFLRNIKEYEIVCLVKRRGLTDFRCSLRSKKVDVNMIAAQFGGGGHRNAAAFKYSGGYTKLLVQLEGVLNDHLRNAEKKSN